MQEVRKGTGGVSLDEALIASEKRDTEPMKAQPELYLILPPKELVFWALFSAGGMVAAFLIPIHVAIMIAFAAGWLPDDALSYERVLTFARHPLAKVFLGILVVMPLYHWAHRFRYTVHHQLGIHGWKRLVATLCYGTAVAGTALTVWVLLRI